MTDTTIVIPTIPPRAALLERAIRSTLAQTLPPAAIAIAIDHDHEGAGPTRTRALQQVTTEWTAFLDDDDELLPHHLEHLHAVQADTAADAVYPWFTVAGGTDPFPHLRHEPWDPTGELTFPITTLVRTHIARTATFPAPQPGHPYSNEDYHYWRALNAAGARIAHTPEITWTWHHDSGNTSGRPERW